MPARCFLNRTPLCRYRFFLRLAFSPCSWFSGLRQVPDLRPERADFSFVWLCVRIHGESLAFLISKKKDGNRSKLSDHRKQGDRQDRLVVKQSHYRAADKPCNSVSGIKQPKCRASFLRCDDACQDRLKQRTLRAHSNSPKDHPN